MVDHDRLIEKLSREARPVKRPWSDGWRVLAWILMALPCGVLGSLLVQRVATDWSVSGAWHAVLQLVLTFVMGVMAIRNAFLLSIAGRKPLGWRWFVPLILLWLVGALSSFGVTPVQAHAADEANCFAFMMTVSTPMMLLVIGYLRRTRALYPLRTLAAAGAGVACMALTLLYFCHPVDIHPMDFLLHLAAVITIVSATIVLGWRLVVIS
ncbi:NrsF family protein [Lelliottia sp. RWM.1]|uniref:NrsF family protein n=1 Tax=Lelliottia sp. RWM.1 TaxID=2663242 RepID=UPI00193DDEB5|nr:NrsF family protein [Lelliottia sp. RWM.1]MBM3073873.1 DUF1109 family protein [Lelliottia sp. RWM.1]